MTIITIAELHERVEAILSKAGLNALQAGAVARVIVAGERDACKSHGIYRIEGVLRTMKAGKAQMDAVPEVLPGTASGIVKVDAKGGFSNAAGEIGLPLLGALLSVPAALAFLLWPAADVWPLGTLRVPHAMVFALLFGFFAAWWPALSYNAVSQMVTASERTVAAAVLNLFITLLGVGLGPLVTGFFSDLLAPVYGAEALRWSLAAVCCLFLGTVFFFSLALKTYGPRLRALAVA